MPNCKLKVQGLDVRNSRHFAVDHLNFIDLIFFIDSSKTMEMVLVVRRFSLPSSVDGMEKIQLCSYETAAARSVFMKGNEVTLTGQNLT